MDKREYRYADNGYNDPWDVTIPKVRQYSRQRFKQDTIDEIEDLWVDVVYNVGDIPSLYCDMGPAFYYVQSDEELREWGYID